MLLGLFFIGFTSCNKKEEAKEVLMGKTIAARPRDIQEIINYRKVVKLIDDEATRKIDKITEQLILKVHRITTEKTISQEQVGIYRLKQVVIRNSATGEITFKPPTPLEVPFLMKEFVYWINKDETRNIHSILKAGIVHHEFVRIHPFIDGNGRVGRVLASLVLLLGGYDIRRFFSLEEYFDKDAISYYEHLQKATAGDLTTWLEYFSFGASVEFTRIKEKIQKISKDVKLKNKMGGQQIFLTERQIKIIEYMQEVGYLQNKAFKTIFPDISEDSVLRDVQDLVKKNLIKKIGSTKSARYVSI